MTQRRLSILFILFTVMINSMGIGLMMPVMPDLIQEVNGGDLAQAAIWGGVLSTTYAVMQFLFGPAMGGLSDRYGRRPVLLVSIAVMALDYVVMALAGSMWLLLATRIVGGITAATQSTATAYMADISTPAERTRNFGLVGAAFGVGFILGPLVGGLLAEYGTRAPFWAAAALGTANLLLGALVLRESVTDDTRRAFEWQRANPLGAVRQLGQLPGVRQLLFMYFLYQVAFSVYPSVWAYFGQAQFGWTPALIGLSLALFGVTMALVQGVLIGPILQRLGERRAILAGYTIAAVSYGTLSVLTSGPVALILTPLAALAGLILPALQGIMSRRVPANAQGEVQGAITSASALAMMLSPLVMTGTFARFTAADAPVYLPGAPFVLACGLTVLGGLLFLTQARRRAPADPT